MLLSSVVSEDGLSPMVSMGWGGVIVRSSLLKKDAVGKNMSSVFDLFAPDPVCICRLISVKVSLIMFAPWIASFLLVKGNALSLR